MPEIRPFRALRYASDAIPDLTRVVAPPYDVISPAEQTALAARDPHNVVRLDLPPDEPGDGPDDRYRRAARTLAAWRSDGTFRKDPRPSIYPYEQAYVVPATGQARVQRGFFARLRLEAFGPGSGVRPHERTMSAPKEDRYKLLRATGANLSAVVVLYEDPSGVATGLLGRVMDQPAEADVIDDDGVRSRLWSVTPGIAAPEAAAADEAADSDDPARALMAAAGRAPVTIADGHHRYETALRYRDERRMTRSCEEEPPFDYLLALFLETTREPPTILPTHRIARGVGPGGLADLAGALDGLFEVRPVASPEALIETMVATPSPPGGGRFGLLMRDAARLLEARRERFEPFLPAGGAALRGLDVTLLGIALERLLGIDAAAVVAGERIAYTRSATEAAARVADRTDGADAAFLLDPTPVGGLLAVAADGDVMPQKSTYFYPKPLTGLVIDPHEW